MSDSAKKDINYLNDLLFDQMVRLRDTQDGDKLREEVARTTAMVKAAIAMVNAGKLGLLAYDHAGCKVSSLPLLVAPEKTEPSKFNRPY